ncbi:hypothetical protein A3C23_03830 [Candidatus Roizmanbacteria bacterium RIFCSPHIGHO2_02_FULL_37_13b]|uniref:UPF0102 protein A3H78_04300 n=1 Tax=Candidatus Roizmanbacteria bacterium RIFCSPLOWO2_02_FULL_36_11 TaxID=1802071 RepID=A0A1F7JHZ6_9BACT|nr:MAG: hypothetical protein A3C23_03830 [Candidatus Roizmanbacteria bacterium RIFCSPHIGHO2_02_FULL_37_13b]OGK55230.1 MAG: hypothetical protein A3H78_04300 [Candidatus Roizmanbacteria bacterium RIFCSPLOWO2_02_FULL_36_11]
MLQKGHKAELLACKYLQKNGFIVLDRNFASRYGEIDIICNKNNTIIFIEVKSRSNVSFGMPYEYITPTKIKKLRRVIQYYISKNNLLDKLFRFDVISIILDVNDEVRDLKHFQNLQINL